MKIALVPWSDIHMNNMIFNVERKVQNNSSFIADLNRYNLLSPYNNLRKKLLNNSIEIDTIDLIDDFDNVDLVFFFDLNYEWLYKCIKNGLEGKLIYFAFEPPVVSKYNSRKNLKKLKNIFEYIFTWDDVLVDKENFIKMNYMQNFFSPDISVENFSEKKLLTIISSDRYSSHPKELYSERKRIIKYFENNHQEDFDFYGVGWNKPKTLLEKIGFKEIENYNNYNGKIDNKFEVYSKYKFAVCFENTKNIKGYITEKIFDCFKSDIIPIYWGAENITDYVPQNCFIDYRNFKSIDHLYKYIKNIKKDEYENYINNIHDFLNSNKIDKFKVSFLYENIIKVVQKYREKEDINGISLSYKYKIYLIYYLKKIISKSKKKLVFLKRLIK